MPDLQSNYPFAEQDTSNVYTVAPGVPFLRTLAQALVSGRLCTPDCDRETWLADSVLFLPTRRAARALGVELQEAAQELTGKSAIMLPRIRTIGDLEEEEGLFGLAGDGTDLLEALPDSAGVIDPVHRHLILARLALSWVKTMTPVTKALFAEEQIVLPSSASDALHLARDLALFMDQFEAEEGNWSDITAIGPEGEGNWGQWWQVTLNFLDIIMQVWPNFLMENGYLNPSQFRNRVIDFRIGELDRNPPRGLVIAAGTTGSIPATARLLAKIKSMERGRIILPGLDRDLPENVVKRFDEVSELSGETVSSTHPQYGLVKLLQKLKTRHRDVVTLGEADHSLDVRERILNTALLPAEDSGLWIGQKRNYSEDEIAQAFSSVSLVEAPGEQEEAASIALVLREALSRPGQTAALVTPDRGLARRVSTALERFDIEIDDSAGSPLTGSKPAIFLRLIMRCVFDKDDPVALSSFLKSDLVNPSGFADISRYRELLELALIRDAIILPKIGALGEAVKEKREAVSKSDHAPRALKNLSDDEWSLLGDLASAISGCLSGLCALAQGKELLRPDEIIVTLKQAGETLSLGKDGLTRLYEGIGGAELAAFLESQSHDRKAEFLFPPIESVAVFDALLSGKRTRKIGRTHPRLHIYGTLEARLQTSDVIILAGMNEGTWPQSTNNDPYLNRPMRAILNLPLPERRIGLSAHDFCQFSGCGMVYYTRSLRVDDTPTIASRWLQRLKTLIGKEQTEQMIERGRTYLAIAQAIDRPLHDPEIIEKPNPCPPVSARPNGMSITDIETWIRDPYAIYAKHVLKLHPLPPLVREADPALRGSIYHAVLAEFVSRWHGPIDGQAREVFRKISDTLFERQNLPPEIHAEWRPRFNPIGEAFLDWEEERRGTIAKSHCELPLRASIGDTGFMLRGRADRIDENTDGTLSVIDYKTGTHPSKKQARIFSPQLSLEAALAKRGDIEGIKARSISEMLYVRLKSGKDFKADDVAGGQDKKQPVLSSDDLAEEAYHKLIDLIEAYLKPDQGYLAQYAPVPNKSYAGDYDHLARIREWSIGEEESTEEGE